MLRWFQALMPKEERFFDLFNRHAKTILDGAEALDALLSGSGSVVECARKVVEFETQADAITRDVLIMVRRSFITPFDRGEIKDLVNTLDDTIDQMQKTVKAITLFEVTSFEPEMAQMGKSIVQSAKLAREAVSLMGKLRGNHGRLNTITEEIIRLEDAADSLNDLGIKALFTRHRDGNAMNYIIGVEIFDHLEKVMDRFEDVANRISGIVIEQM